MSRASEWLSASARCVACRKGGIAIFMAIALPVLLVVMGFVVDYGYASYLNQRLGRAADAAALSAVSQAGAAAVGGFSNTSSLQTLGTSVFNETVKPIGLSNITFNLKVTQGSNSVVTATATYSYNATAFFGSLYGRNTLPMSGTITASSQPPTYVNYYLLVDVSNSMGIGATQADMQLIYNKTASMGYSQNGEPGCVFACHVPNQGRQYSTEQLARQVNATLRIDSAVSAIQSIISAASSIASSTKNIQFGIYLLQNNPNNNTNVVVLSNPSTNYSNLISLASTIDLGPNNSNSSVGDTEFQSALSNFNSNSQFGVNGTGLSASSPLNYVFLITDGVEDTLNTGSFSCGSSTSCVNPITTSWCNSIKAKATVGVIYTTYLPIYNNNNPSNGYELLYGTYVNPIANQILPNLQGCATSSDLFFEASDGPSITTSMQALFAKTQPGAPRLTQ